MGRRYIEIFVAKRVDYYHAVRQRTEEGYYRRYDELSFILFLKHVHSYETLLNLIDYTSVEMSTALPGER